MQKMLRRILFIGLGGAGQRHLRLLRESLPDVEFIAYRSTNKTPLLNVDFSVNQDASIEESYHVDIYNNLDEALSLEPNLAVISTPSSMHLKYAQLCAEKGIDIFVEKPLSNSTDGLQKLKDTIKENNVAIQVGFQRRFHPHFNRVNNIIQSGKIGKILTASFTVASYIPRWHPYENYLDLYACRKELGGGVLLTEIHEIDLAVWYFGMPQFVTCVGGAFSNVGMDVEDTVSLILDYTKFMVRINLTFWQKHHERSLSINGENGRLDWNQDDDILVERYFDYPRDCVANVNPSPGNETMFESQIRSIVENLDFSSGEENINNSIMSLKIVDSAKKSMVEGKTIKLI